jgi:hypothetical protein
MAKKSKKRLDGMAFNALGIVFILAVLPIAVAFVSSASGIASKDEPMTSIMPIYQPATQDPAKPFFKWVDNGQNVSSWYESNYALPVGDEAHYNCIFIQDGACKGVSPTTSPSTPSVVGYWPLPYAQGVLGSFESYKAPQNHADSDVAAYASGSPTNYVYRGASGDTPFKFSTWGRYYEIDSTQSLDTLKISFVDYNTFYSETNAIFENITFQHQVSFSYYGESLTIDLGRVKTSNQLCYDVLLTSGWSHECAVGFSITYDLTSFESHRLQTIVNGDYDNMSMTFSFSHFKTTDDNKRIGNTALPFTGIDSFAFGLEAQFVDTQQLNFLVRGGSMLIGVICVVVAISSTPYYDPLKNMFMGAE